MTASNKKLNIFQEEEKEKKLHMVCLRVGCGKRKEAKLLKNLVMKFRQQGQRQILLLFDITINEFLLSREVPAFD